MQCDFNHKIIHKYTWGQHTNNLKTNIDNIIRKQYLKLKMQDVRAYGGIKFGTDHKLIIAKILKRVQTCNNSLFNHIIMERLYASTRRAFKNIIVKRLESGIRCLFNNIIVNRVRTCTSCLFNIIILKSVQACDSCLFKNIIV